MTSEVRADGQRAVKYNENTGDEEDGVYYYHGDHIGSAQVVTNHEGMIYERYEYTPYGEVWIEWENRNVQRNEALPFRFTGKELDEETGLYYYGARYLDPRVSRWLSADPAVGEYIPEAPVDDEARRRNGNLPGMGGIYNLVNLHLYHYAGNNPVKYTDPDGKQSMPYFSPEESFSILAERNPVVGLFNLINNALSGDKSAQSYTGYLVHEASIDVLQSISDNSTKATLIFLVAGAPEAAGASSLVGIAADTILAIDQMLNGDMVEGAVNMGFVVAGYVTGKAVSKMADKAIDVGLNIHIGKNNRFYSLGRRGAMNTWEATAKQITGDLAELNIPAITQTAIIDAAKKAYNNAQQNVE
jgi:RHS repeat-associated protein